MTLAENSSSENSTDAKPISGVRFWCPTRRAIIATMVLMIPWILIVVPAWNWNMLGGNTLRVHGWPYIHHWREVSPQYLSGSTWMDDESFVELECWEMPTDSLNGMRSEFPTWTDPSNWSYLTKRDRRSAWHFGPLMFNAAIGLAIFCMLLFTLEVRIRRRGGLFRWRVIDVFVLLGILAVPLGVIGDGLNGSERDQEAYVDLDDLIVGPISSTKRVGIPVWLNRILDNRTESIAARFGAKSGFIRVTSLNFSYTDFDYEYSQQKIRVIANKINDMNCVNKIRVFLGAKWQMELITSINPNRARWLVLDTGLPDVNEQQLALLAKMNRVQHLSIFARNSTWSNRNLQSGPGPSVDVRQQMLIACASMPQIRQLDLPDFGIGAKDCPVLLKLDRLKTLSCLIITAEAKQILLDGNPQLVITGDVRETFVGELQ